MGLFSRNSEALQSARGDDPPFDMQKRSPRNTRSRASTDDAGRETRRESRLDAPPPLDPARTAKTRARRRLIGAVALAAAAVVFVPMLFDRTPVAPPDDIALSIPDRDTPFEARKGVPEAARAPLKGAAELPTLAPSLPPPTPAAPPDAAPVEPVVPEPAAKAVEAPRPAEPPASKVATKTVEAGHPAPVVERSKPVAAPAPVTTPPAGPTDDPKALAALAGRVEPAAASTAPAPAAPGDRTFAVQIAAYSSADKARAMRDSLVANGLRSYVESVSTPQGLRTRVRLGPFPSRDAADHARQKLKTMKLDGSVVPL